MNMKGRRKLAGRQHTFTYRLCKGGVTRMELTRYALFSGRPLPVITR